MSAHEGCDRCIDGNVCGGTLARTAAPPLHELPVEMHTPARSRHVEWFRCRSCGQDYSALRESAITPRSA